MATRKILHDGDPILRKISKPVQIFDDKLVELFDDMSETMKKADGAGLSAVQVGILKRMFVMNDHGTEVRVVNPEIIKTSGENKIMVEGCLSVPDKCGEVERPNVVRARFQNQKGEWIEQKFNGFSAKAFLHEYDHLDGILYIDKALNLFNNYQEYFKFKEKRDKKEQKNKGVK